MLKPVNHHIQTIRDLFPALVVPNAQNIKFFCLILYKPSQRGETADKVQMFSILESKSRTMVVSFPKLARLLKSSKEIVVNTILEVVKVLK